jgi:AhpD family alkylhydroperoxidase
MARMMIGKVVPDGYRAVNALHDYVQASVEPRIHELVKIRASQINGCAYCLDMHSRDARSIGESQQRLDTLAAWRETSFFDERERAALALTEAITLIAGHHMPAEAWEQAALHFTQEELANLVLAIAQINTWNRIAISTGMEPRPRVDAAAK